MRRVRFAILPCLALIAAGCGGGSASVEQVPGPPVTLSEPGNPAALAPTTTPTATTTATTDQTTAGATATPTPTTTPQTGTAGATPTPPASSTGTQGTADTGTADGQSTASTDQPPPPGSDAQKFEDFCAQNPGAC